MYLKKWALTHKKNYVGISSFSPGIHTRTFIEGPITDQIQEKLIPGRVEAFYNVLFQPGMSSFFSVVNMNRMKNPKESRRSQSTKFWIPYMKNMK